MALTTSQINPNATFASGGLEGAATNVVTAVFWNRLMNLLFAHLGTAGYIGCRAFHSAAQSTTTGIAAALFLNSESFDASPDGLMHDNSTNNPRVVCRTAGLYLITAYVSFDSNATGYRQVAIRMNGAAVIAAHTQAAASGNTTDFAIAVHYPLAASDYVEVWGLQTSGGALNVAGNATVLTAVKV